MSIFFPIIIQTSVLFSTSSSLRHPPIHNLLSIIYHPLFLPSIIYQYPYIIILVHLLPYHYPDIPCTLFIFISSSPKYTYFIIHFFIIIHYLLCIIYHCPYFIIFVHPFYSLHLHLFVTQQSLSGKLGPYFT